MIKVHMKTDVSNLRKRLEQTKKNEVDIQVGYFNDSSPQHQGSEPGVTIAQVAAENEFGSSYVETDERGQVFSVPIPARPFMAQTVQNTNIKKYMLGWARDTIRGVSRKPIELAAWFTQKIKDTIDNGQFVPNAPSTIQMKGHDKVLIDSTQMRMGIEARHTKDRRPI